MSFPIEGWAIELNVVPRELFLDGFSNPSVAGDIARTRAPRMVDRLERLGRQPQIYAIQSANRWVFWRIDHAARLAPFWRHVQYVLYLFRAGYWPASSPKVPVAPRLVRGTLPRATIL